VHRDEAYLGKKPAVLVSAPQYNATFITFNADHFPDARVRRALSLALDRDKFVPAVLHSFAIPGHSLVRPGPIYTAPPSSACRFDPAEAKRLLAEAGFPDGKGFPAVNLMLVGNDAETVNIGAVVQQAWKTILGVQCNLQPTEMKVYLDAERTGHFAAVIERWNPSNSDPTNMLQMGVTDNPNNDSRWSNPEYDQMFAEADESADPERRERDFDRMEMILADEVPYAPLFHRNPVRLVSPDVKGWQPNPLNHVTWRLISLSK
jgi:oligopeptide transport system substrate-binding protein